MARTAANFAGLNNNSIDSGNDTSNRGDDYSQRNGIALLSGEPVGTNETITTGDRSHSGSAFEGVRRHLDRVKHRLGRDNLASTASRPTPTSTSSSWSGRLSSCESLSMRTQPALCLATLALGLTLRTAGAVQASNPPAPIAAMASLHSTTHGPGDGATARFASAMDEILGRAGSQRLSTPAHARSAGSK